MNLEKVKALEEEFLYLYPKGFQDEKFFPTMKNFKPEKLEEFAHEHLSKNSFSNPNMVIENWYKTIQKSVMVSLFDKLKLKDMIASLNSYEKDMLSIEIYELLYGDKKEGFEGLCLFLGQYSLAKWTILSVVPYSLYRQKEYFIKPTTTKTILKYFECEHIVYKPKPSFEFYNEYKNILDELKSKVDNSLSYDNAAFTGFLRESIKL